MKKDIRQIYISKDEAEELYKFMRDNGYEYIRVDYKSSAIWHSITLHDPVSEEQLYKIPLSKNDGDNL